MTVKLPEITMGPLGLILTVVFAVGDFGDDDGLFWERNSFSKSPRYSLGDVSVWLRLGSFHLKVSASVGQPSITVLIC